MTEFVRIDTGNGRAASINKDYIDGLAKKPAVLKDAESVDVRGLPLVDTRLDGRAEKSRTTVAKAAASKAPTTTPQGGVVAADSKEKEA